MVLLPCKTLRLRFLSVVWLVSCCCALEAKSSDWGEVLAAKFSKDWQKAQKDRSALEVELRRLPEISLLDFGGPLGYRSDNLPGAKHPYYDDQWLQVHWGNAEVVDLVAVVPARHFDEYGIDPNYDLPEDFRVLLVDEQGKTLKVLAEEQNTRSDPVRKGHPFCYRVDPPLRCSGVRIESKRMYVNPSKPKELHFVAFSEIFCFQGELNVARGAQVTSNNTFQSPWPWKSTYLTDEVTGLGLSDIIDPTHNGIGWITGGSVQAEQDSTWVQVDLGSVRTCDGIRMFPPERPRDLLIPGHFYPLRFVIEVSLSGESGTYQTVFSNEEDFDSPGHHAVTLQWPMTDARFVRFRALTLRKIASGYPAFLGFSELQILQEGQNIARNCAVNASEIPAFRTAYENLFWSAQSLTDGYTSRGEILSDRQWMEQLQRRYEVESEILLLDNHAAAIAARFRQGMTSAGGVLGASMLAALIALPIRHRRREARNLRALRARIAADLHDDIGSSMGGIQLLTESALNKPELAVERLNTIRLLSTGTIASLRDIVWLLRPGSAFQSPVLGHFRETASILLDDLKWDFKSDEASRNHRLARETNRHLLLLFREALHNSLRHAKCSFITIRTSLHNQVFTLEVRDDGCGISEKQLASPFCLRALKERAGKLGGTLETISALDRGTTIILRFPITRSNSAKPL